MKKISIFVLISLALILAACAPSTANPDAGMPGGNNPVNITVATSPSPAMMGELELILTITDANGNPIEGAKVDVSVDHTDMTGMGMSGPAADQGGGKYAINANFSMSGNWKLTVYVRKEGLDYKEDVEFPVQ